MSMTKFLSRLKKKINTKRYFLFSIATILLLFNSCAQKLKNSKQIETVTKALEFLQKEDSTSFYSLIDTSFVIDLKGREGMSNAVKNAALFLKKIWYPSNLRIYCYKLWINGL